MSVKSLLQPSCRSCRRATSAVRPDGRRLPFVLVAALAVLVSAGVGSAAATGTVASPDVAAPDDEGKGIGDGAADGVQAGDLPHLYPDDPIRVDDDRLGFPEPGDFGVSEMWNFVRNSFMERDPAKIEMRRAVNVNTVGGVPDSSWFTNRHGRRRMSVEELVRGPDTTGGPAPGTWTIVGRPSAGAQPKFTIQDPDGDRYLLKFDPPSNPEMASSAEVIATKFFHAFGYHVTETYIVTVDPADLEIAEDATWETAAGAVRTIRRRDVDHWLRRAARNPDGTYRALASRWIPGTPVGEFRYYGTRPDDPNDVFPHQHRRELRGLRVFAAWLHHNDSRAKNTLDVYVGEDGAGHIRHYLLDFGSTLGSGTFIPDERRGGNEYVIELDKAWKGIWTLGFWLRPWVSVRFPHHPSIGNIEADFFEPAEWRPEYPNPAFVRMDAADAFWAAKIVARFTDEEIAAIVATGEITDPLAERYLTETIRSRRDEVVRYWLTRTNPLDGFRAERSADGTVSMHFENAAVLLAGVEVPDGYRIRWRSFDNGDGGRGDVVREATLEGERVLEPGTPVPEEAFGEVDRHGFRYAHATVSTDHPDHPDWKEPVVVVVRDRGDHVDVAAVIRPGIRLEPPD